MSSVGLLLTPGLSWRRFSTRLVFPQPSSPSTNTWILKIKINEKKGSTWDVLRWTSADSLSDKYGSPEHSNENHFTLENEKQNKFYWHTLMPQTLGPASQDLTTGSYGPSSDNYPPWLIYCAYKDIGCHLLFTTCFVLKRKHFIIWIW